MKDGTHKQLSELMPSAKIEQARTDLESLGHIEGWDAIEPNPQHLNDIAARLIYDMRGDALTFGISRDDVIAYLEAHYG